MEPISRRTLLAGAVVGGAGAAFLGGGSAAAAVRPDPEASRNRITVLGTTDLHGHVLSWDYFTDATYTDRGNNDVGVAKIATLVDAVRAERGARSTLLLDAGDTIQGTPLAYYYARVDPITGPSHPIHPMAAAMNELRYDAAALGNHEFNYGIDVLRAWEAQLHHPLLGANVRDWDTGAAAFTPFVIKDVPVGSQGIGQGANQGRGPSVKVGIVGLVTPGCAIWDKANVEGRLRFTGIVEQAQQVVPQVRAAGADVVIVSCHSGTDGTSSYGDALPYPENAATLLAEQVPGIDAILVGHAHQEIPQRYATNTATGKQVLLSEPLKWGMRLTVMDLDLTKVRGRWQVQRATATLLDANTVEAKASVVEVVRAQHEATRTYVNGTIGRSTTTISAATARYEDGPALDLVNRVQAEAVRAALAGTSDASTPILSIAAPFSADARIPAGDVSVRDVAGLYTFDNTLLGIAFTGAQVRAYLEFSARYFQQVSGTGPFTPDQVTNARTPLAPSGTPDYNYDVVAGLDAPLAYEIDIAAAPGARIANLTYAGAAVSDAQRFVLAVNNYRQSGGGNFPGVTGAPVLHNAQQEIRQLIIDWVGARGTIDPATFSSDDWRLVSGGAPVVIRP